MAFAYLTPENVFKAFKDSEKYMRPLFEPLSEYERLARNLPHPGIDKAYPKVTDGTLSSIIQKTPRRIIQQTPTGKVESEDDNDWLPVMAQWLLDNEILPHANGQYPLIEKCWAVVEKGLTYGSQCSLDMFVHRDGRFTTDFTVPYIKDVFYEPGKVSDIDSNYKFIRAWYQKSDLQSIIAKESKLREDGVDSGWDISVLRKIMDMLSQKDDLSTTPNEKAKNNRQGGIGLIHCFQVGVEAKFYTIHMKTQKIARTKVNKDPRGVMPGNNFYAGVDMSNPLGRGYGEQVGGMQNLLDSEVQMYQYNRALMLNPPMIKRGTWNKNQAKMAPNVLVDLGNIPTNSWEPVKIDSTSLQTFPNNYGLMKSQILNLLSSPDTSVSAEVGNPGFSKTDAGVKSQQAVLSIDDNFIRKNFEAWWERECETLINLYFGERTGVEEFVVDEETAEKLRDIDESVVNEKNQVRIDFSSETPKLKFTVDAGSSEKQDDTAEIAELKEILADVNANPTVIQSIQQAGKQLNMGEVYKQLFQKLGLKEMDKILTDLPRDAQGNPQTTPPTPESDKVSLNYTDLDPTAKAAYLQSINIPADPQQIAQYEQAKAASEKPTPETGGIENHPLVKLMSSLQIKFTDLPEDSKHELLTALGLPSSEQTPVQQDMSLKAIQTAHTINTSSEQQLNQQAQMAQQDKQNEAQNALSAQSQDSKQPATAKAERTAPAPAQSTQLSPEDEAYLQELLKMGLSQQQAGQALALIHHGYAPEDVIKMIGANNG